MEKETPSQTAGNFFTQEEGAQIIAAIQNAENHSTGEIRVHIEESAGESVLDTARMVFERLGMRNTDERNGVLIFLAVSDRKFAVLGDDGINEKVSETYWQEMAELLKKWFVQKDYSKGLLEVIEKLGKTLSNHFPYDPLPENELPDEVSFGE